MAKTTSSSSNMYPPNLTTTIKPDPKCLAVSSAHPLHRVFSRTCGVPPLHVPEPLHSLRQLRPRHLRNPSIRLPPLPPYHLVRRGNDPTETWQHAGLPHPLSAVRLLLLTFDHRPPLMALPIYSPTHRHRPRTYICLLQVGQQKQRILLLPNL